MPIYPYFDAHCDTLYRCQLEGWDLWSCPAHADLQRLSAYSPMGQVFALWTPSAGKTPEECFAIISAQYEIYRKAKEARPQLMSHCHLSVEGAEMIDCNPDLLPMLKDWGVRWINLTWNYETALGHPHTVDKGLTPQGRAFAKRVYELGMYVDISHLSEQGFWDLAKTVEGPIVASHCNSRSLRDHSRNISDAVAKEIIARKGLIGLNFYHGFLSNDNATADTVVEHLEHFLDMGGEDCLCIGGDFDGTAWLLKDISAVDKVPLLWEALYRRNYSRDLVEKIAFGNLAAFLEGRPAGK